jgi:hypothetical protein
MPLAARWGKDTAYIILEYIDEKVAGLYGHSKLQLRRFTARRAEQRSGDTRTKKAA